MKYTQKKALRWMVAMGLTMTAFSWGNVEAMPTGGEVRSGDAEIKTSGQTMDIDQKTSRVALDWTGFDIAKGETVRFHQNPSDIAINRILGNKASEIYGSLLADGTVFLLNPQGILFGQGAQVDVGNLIASTAQVDDSFMKGFSAGGDVSLNLGEASKGKVINAGDIKAQGGLVALHAANVENTGSIKNDGGKVSLAAVKNLELAIDTAGKINFETSGETANAHTLNAGTIQADGGYVVMTAKSAGDMLSEVVNNTGIIEAKTASINAKGEILLDGGEYGTVNVSGKLDASGLAEGQSGGNVRILGENTIVKDGAKLTARGDKDGGLVETSGDVLDVSTKADIEAKGRTGKAGEWLLDPMNVYIGGTENGTIYTISDGVNTIDRKDIGTDYSFITANSIMDRLNKGTDVTIIALDNTAARNSNIIVAAPITMTSGEKATLTLEAERNVIVKKEISASGNNKLNVVLHADTDGDAKGMVAISADINTNGGAFTAGAWNVNADGEITVGTYFGPYDVENNTPTNDKQTQSSINLITNGGNVNLYGDVAMGLNEGTLTIDTTTKSGSNGTVNITGNVDSLNTYKVISKDCSKEELDSIVEKYYDNYLYKHGYYNDWSDLPPEEKNIIKKRFESYGGADRILEEYYVTNFKKDYPKTWEELKPNEQENIKTKFESKSDGANSVEDYYSKHVILKDLKELTPEEQSTIKNSFALYGGVEQALKDYYKNKVQIPKKTYRELVSSTLEADKNRYKILYNTWLALDAWNKIPANRESILNRWELAKEAAKEGTAGGANVGDKYLATITTALEEWIVGSRLENVSANQFFVGGHTVKVDSPKDRVFRWETGPEGENGETSFYTTTDAGKGYVSLDMYQDWLHNDKNNNNDPNNDSKSPTNDGQPCLALRWRANDSFWSDVDNQQSNVKGFIQETNTQPSSFKVNSGSANVTIGGNIGKSARLHELDITTSGKITIGGGINYAAKNNAGTGNQKLDNALHYYSAKNIKADIVKLGVEESYRYNNSVERPQFASLTFTPITGEADYREVQEEKNSSVEQVLGLTTAKLPLVKEVNGMLTSYGTYRLAVAPDKVTMELADTSVPVPANSIHDQYREYTKNLTTKRGAADFKLSYDGSVFALHPIGQEAEKMLEAGDAAHNVDVVSQALYTAFHDMGLTLDDLDAVYVCFA
ncbi:filamentous hemagglutinin N-terminal domain-containing protein [Selenomonas ruminantium]|uniref:two-partner secretion domain-containing protein n=1 Tax=Selenomonas ruminantium TaxID=971 RepID=UPI00047C4F3B|nr:filamentous hemagglutinin N-terminal domain-containing protein [Selenomonas ruminantium]